MKSRKSQSGPKRLDEIMTFLAVVEHGNLTAAARHLGRPLQSASRQLAALERALGVELVRRTTHHSQPTEAGLAFYRRVKPALSEIEDAGLEAANRGAEPSGTLRVGASVLFAPIFVVPLIARFMAGHPRVLVDLRLSDRFVDLAEEGLDLAIRIGELGDTDLKARRLGAQRRVVFGAPSYLAARGRPRHPRDLADHACVIRTTDPDPHRWEFVIDGKLTHVRVDGAFRSDSTTAVHAAVAEGLGLGVAPLWQLRPLLQAGAIEILLADYKQPPVPIHAVWPPSKLLAARTRLFIDHLAAELARDVDAPV
ncbi:LysR family transcriptional regulator [Bradyrhizobium sp. U87765 SZCCT0131]|uniref:LysR family transcriptional regulator n=1 Tax=unclassified Bradyrhizobium TaxID=2631580 RepID=UPI001BA7DB5B|nr:MULTISPECIES: LysR family transcriptional regulator [unclassified Bradyrhizobium]MBR1219046.1 LysR family transcriptional regulator [Bradyrhizobium sp. U87765 SZCCT0131]MBR1261697.1 LysR family transcriptional regulator [Bradyrhizobium sp. U87765 SZCCT0134]MBR1306450.1 LysR family transcriptional regulator [Bradyrhizobium sp. U87765 SZCCT0110]MBR1317479.1 LysR family transcriptional regulator [Bradyrhizobium sp. U87765 SZCCT0109]MBR1351181.1 LysR family transcriptional regulator [Bradyrhizo